MSKFIKPDKDDWIFGIKKVSNGYVIQKVNGIDENEQFHIEEEVIQQNESEYEATLDLLYSVLDFFGPRSNDHNKKNIKMTLEEQEL